MIAEATVASMQPLAQERQLHLTVHAAQPVTCRGDEARLIQAMMNLLANALRATPAGGQVKLSVTSDAGGAHVQVQDTGSGIAPEDLPHIFERFYRADPARRQTDEGGSGLGLAIVAWIVRMHGGSIAMKSQVGQGSCFTLTFPLDGCAPRRDGE